MSNLKKCMGILAGLASFGVTSMAFAQVQADANAGANTNTNVGMTLPGAAPAATATGSSDHDQVVGRLAVGYLGRRSIAVGVGAADAPGLATFDPAFEAEAPVVGIRYWIDSMLGIDAGLGILLSGGGWELDSPAAGGDDDGDLGSATAFLLHVGVPLSLASYDHFSFQVVPEANVGLGSGSADTDAADVSYNGFQLDVGARAGAEIQFGFMGIPQLSLQGSVGVLFGLQSLKTEVDPAGGGGSTTVTQNRTVLTTTVGDNPWNIFTSNVAALYYF
jgi:hypothetical protein